MNQNKPAEVRWAEKKLKKDLTVYYLPHGQYYVNISDADLDKLTKGPSIYATLACVFGGFAVGYLIQRIFI